MAKAASRLNLVVATVFVTSIAWLGVAALRSGTLETMFTVKRGPVEQGNPAPTAPPTAAPTGLPTTGPSRTAIHATAATVVYRGGALVIPVAGVRPEQLVDTFTQSRANGARQHDAIDIMAAVGTPVLAASAGTVEKVFLSKDGGNTLYLRSTDGLTIYYYAHLDAYAPGLREGMAVTAGQPIGTVGFSGNANPAAPHLHFAVWITQPGERWYGEHQAVNPYPLLTAR